MLLWSYDRANLPPKANKNTLQRTLFPEGHLKSLFSIVFLFYSTYHCVLLWETLSFLLSGSFCCYFKQLTPGEGHDRLRRVDSNRRSRSFSKQPSTGDYYKNLSSDSAEAQGSRGMAPNEEVIRPSAGFLTVAAAHLICFTSQTAFPAAWCHVAIPDCSVCTSMMFHSCCMGSLPAHANCLLVSMASCLYSLFWQPSGASSRDPTALTRESSCPLVLVLLARSMGVAGCCFFCVF